MNLSDASQVGANRATSIGLPGGASASRLVSIRQGLHDVVTPPRGQLPSLDALRSLAILMVITGHFALVGREVFATRAAVFRTPPFWFGWTGVDLFFVLSGFLIGRQLWREVAQTGSVDVGGFILRRGFRIWPLYFFAVGLSPVLTATWSYRWSDWLFLSNYFECRVEGGWSLSTEEQFYIVAPILIVLGARFLRPRAWIIVIPILIAVVEVARWLTARALLPVMSVLDTKQAMYSPFHLHNEGLAIGLLIALAAVYFPQWIDAAPGYRIRTGALVTVSFALAIALRRANDVVFPFLSLALIYGAIAVALRATGADRLRLLRARPFYTTSRLSYGMYLNHFAVLRWITPALARAARQAAGESVLAIAIALLATCVCSAAIAFATFILIERPFLLLRARVLRDREHRPSQAVPAFATQ